MEEDEIVAIVECPGLMEKRQRYFGILFMKPEEITQAPIVCILKFIANTGLMV